MKNVLLILAAAAALGLASCSKDDTYAPSRTTQVREAGEEPAGHSNMLKPKDKQAKQTWE